MKKQEHFNIGVIIARFQVAQLHEGHRTLIKTVQEASDKTLVLLGTTVVQDSIRDPLSFELRKAMVEQSTRCGTMILPIPDIPDDTRWSKEVDKRIKEVFPMGKIALFGSKDSFIKSYNGHYRTIEIDEVESASGTEQRNAIATNNSYCDSIAFRAGVIHAKANQWPKFHPTVDVAIWRDKNAKGDIDILFGKKPGETLWRLVGGFMDPGKDKTAEQACKREAGEETGGNLELATPEYICTSVIDDWRYNDGRNKIMTTFFAAQCAFGFAEASDDLKTVCWMPLAKLRAKEVQINPSHTGLVATLLEKKWPQQ